MSATRGELRRWANQQPDDPWSSRETMRNHLTRLQLYERNEARKRRMRVRGPSERGRDLARATVLRFIITSPMFFGRRRREALS